MLCYYPHVFAVLSCGGGGGAGAPVPGGGAKTTRPKCMQTAGGANRKWTDSSQDKDFRGDPLPWRRGGGSGYGGRGKGAASGGSMLITGSRTYGNRAQMRQAILDFKPSQIIHGGAKGADSMAESIARDLGIPTRIYPIQWRSGGVYNNRAGFERNSEMLWMNPTAKTKAFFDGRITGGTGDTVGKSIMMGQGITPSMDIFGITAANLARQGLTSIAQALSRFLGSW